MSSDVASVLEDSPAAVAEAAVTVHADESVKSEDAATNPSSDGSIANASGIDGGADEVEDGPVTMAWKAAELAKVRENLMSLSVGDGLLSAENISRLDAPRDMPPLDFESDNLLPVTMAWKAKTLETMRNELEASLSSSLGSLPSGACVEGTIGATANEIGRIRREMEELHDELSLKYGKFAPSHSPLLLPQNNSSVAFDSSSDLNGTMPVWRAKQILAGMNNNGSTGQTQTTTASGDIHLDVPVKDVNDKHTLPNTTPTADLLGRARYPWDAASSVSCVASDGQSDLHISCLDSASVTSDQRRKPNPGSLRRPSHNGRISDKNKVPRAAQLLAQRVLRSC